MKVLGAAGAIGLMSEYVGCCGQEGEGTIGRQDSLGSVLQELVDVDFTFVLRMVMAISVRQNCVML